MKFKERVQRYASRLWWSFKYGPASTDFSIPASGVRPAHLGIVLPPEFADFDVARHILEPLMQRLRPHHATVLVRENFRTWLSSDLGARIFTFNVTDKNWLGFPPQSVLGRARDLELDVLIDLTPAYSPYTAALSASTRAPLRISFDTGDRTDFYNFVVQFEADKPLAERYGTLMRYV